MYKISLPNFEGPFDLLLYFIKRDEINIYDIPIAKITEEFQNYIRLMQYFDLELAGEFLLMASTLMYIKTQMLLPRTVSQVEDNEIEDPRTQLVQRLIEYKQFKEAAQDFGRICEEQRYVYYRKFFESDFRSANGNGAVYKNASLFELLKAFKLALDRASKENTTHVVKLFPATVDEKKDMIMKMLKKRKRISFFELTDNNSRPNIIVTFLALLEMIKHAVIVIFQTDTFDDIIITSKPVINLN